jgi:hypothetical protein
MHPYDKQSREHQTTNQFFVHNCFGSFFNGILNWFGDDFYPRFNYKVIGTYDKAVEYFKKRKEEGGDAAAKMLPSITLDPMLDFSNAEQGGQFMWQYSRYAPGMGVRLWSHIDLKEQDVLVTPVFSRYQGTFEVTFWLSSIYELMDFRVSLLQFCGGFNRWCRPEIFWSYLVLPDDVSNYEKQDGEKIDWSNTLSEIIHVQTLNKHKRVAPVVIDPMWKLDSFNDATTKYGGDTIAEYKLTASFTYEVNLPTYVVVSENLDARIDLNLSMGTTYSNYPLISPYKILKSLQNEDSTQKYLDDNYNFYKIQDDVLEKENLLIEFSSDSLVYPEKIEEWNHITYGTLLYVTDEFINDKSNKVGRDDIVIVDSYKPQYLPYIRKANSVISVNDTKSTQFYSKCEILKKPCVCMLSQEEADIVKSQHGKPSTLDSRKRKFYDGILEVIKLDNNDPEASFDTLSYIKDNDPDIYEAAIQKTKDNEFPYDVPQHRATETISEFKKKILCDFTDGIQTEFQLEYILDDSTTDSLTVYIDDNLKIYLDDYTIEDNQSIVFNEAPPRGSSVCASGELFVLKESRLVAIYEFTDDDLLSTEPTFEIDLPGQIARREDIVLVSYTGKLEYERDYEINLETGIITIKINPKVGEIIQFFYYV